jgi:hypothetical protein
VFAAKEVITTNGPLPVVPITFLALPTGENFLYAFLR